MLKEIKRFFKSRWFYLPVLPRKPISNVYGLDRGKAVDRYFINKFLSFYKKDIHGHVLEVGNNHFTRIYGAKTVVQSDVLDINPKNSQATIHGDIRNLVGIKDRKYDCIILTQVLQFIDDYESAAKECFRILKLKGVLLLTVPALSRIDCVAKNNGDFWRFTGAGVDYFLSKFFDKKNITVKSFGNVASGLAFWLGLAQEDIPKKDLKGHDSQFPVVIGARAVKE